MAGDTSGVLQLATNGSTTAVTVDASQNVGIGTTSPLSKLDIIVNTADGNGITVKNNNNSAYFTLDANGATGYGVTGWANSTVLESVPASTGGLVLGSYTGNITFQTARTERMRIDSSGNVGIGTTSPVSRLELSSSATSAAAGFTSTNTNSAGYSTLQLRNTGTSGRTYTIAVGGNTSGNPGAFYVYDDTAPAERMRIDSSGRVGIAKSSGLTGQLNVGNGQGFSNGTGALTLAAVVLDGNYGGGLSFIDGSQGYSLWSQTSGADFYIRRATTTGAFTGGVFINNAATSWSAASDENVKDIIEPIGNAIEKVLTLRTVIGKYKDEEEGIRHPFLIAQDVEKVLPEAVSIMNKNSENECLGLSYTDTIPLLVAAIKEQQTIINDLKARITALEGAA
jgi:hypothetical protein